MKKFIHSAGFIAAALSLALAVAFVVSAFSPTPAKFQHEQVSPYLKVIVKNGTGSGVHIGSGYVLTAEHVVESQRAVQVKGDDGSITDADILWGNDQYDVALLRVRHHERIASASLVCDDPYEGEEITAHGNPSYIEFISTRGHITGKPQSVARSEANHDDAWKKGVFVDAPIAPGMSGGGVTDGAGNVVGIVVGAMLTDLGAGYPGMHDMALSGIGVIVPSSVLCELMGRN